MKRSMTHLVAAVAVTAGALTGCAPDLSLVPEGTGGQGGGATSSAGGGGSAPEPLTPPQVKELTALSTGGDLSDVSCTQDGMGSFWLAGTFRTPLTLGATVLPSSGGDDAFVAQLGEVGGKTAAVQSLAYGGSANQSLTSLAGQAAGGVVLGANLTGAFVWGETTYDPEPGQHGLLGGIDSALTETSSVYLSGTGYSEVADIAALGDKRAAVGSYAGNVDVDGVTTPASQGLDAFLVLWDASTDGKVVQTLGGADDQVAAKVVLTPSGEVVLGLSFRGTLEVPGLGAFASVGGQDVALVGFGEDGTPTWVKAFGDAADQTLTALSAGKDGDLLWAATTTGATWDLGQGAVDTSAGALTARVDPQGAPRWAQGFAGLGEVRVNSFVETEAGEAVWAGEVSGSATWAGLEMGGAAKSHAWLAGADEEGKNPWALVLGGDGEQTWNKVLRTGDDVVACGTYVGEASAGALEVAASEEHTAMWMRVGRQ